MTIFEISIWAIKKYFPPPFGAKHEIAGKIIVSFAFKYKIAHKSLFRISKTYFCCV